MQRRMAERPEEFSALQQQHRFGGKGREGSQSAQKAGDDKQSPFRRQARVTAKKRYRNADQETTAQIGDDRTERQMAVNRVQQYTQPPA